MLVGPRAQVADAEFKPDLTAKIAALVQRYAPDKRWHCDSLLQARGLGAHAACTAKRDGGTHKERG